MSLLTQHFSSDRAMAELGYRIRPLEETVRDSWQWFLAHGYARAPGRQRRRAA